MLGYLLAILTAWLVVGFIVGVVFGSACRLGECPESKRAGYDETRLFSSFPIPPKKGNH